MSHTSTMRGVIYESFVKAGPIKAGANRSVNENQR